MTDQPSPAAEGTTNPVGALLVGSAVPALLAAAALTAAAALFGLNQVTSSLVGAGMALLALAVGPLLHQLCRNVDPTMVVGIVVCAYGTIIGLLWIGFSLLNDTDWLVGEFAAAGVFVVAVGWAVGHMRAAVKLRQPLYQQDESTAGR
ncbi:MAG TPA: hypothetical protein VLL08_02845 [Kineosporiaceae bacterium]|nr:hypothetical protein [Kineosporiaceae bacterium]